MDVIKIFGEEAYDFTLRETQTYEILEDVSRMKSEIGILYISSSNKNVIRKIIKEKGLEFHLLFKASPHVFISSEHPLANEEEIELEDLEYYPYLTFEQGDYNSFYFSEELISPHNHKKNIQVRDRATLFNLVIGLNGYTISSGVIDKDLNVGIIAKPLHMDSCMEIGFITQTNRKLSTYGKIYIESLKKHIEIGENNK